MMSEEKKVLADLENNIPYDYCRSCDSEDGIYHEYIDEDSWQYKVKMLLEEKENEIARLNNIINELEKEIKWQRKICLSLNNYGVSVCDILLNKLQELKGSNE